MPKKTIEADLSNVAHKIGIVASQWNSFVTDKLISGAVELLERHGVSGDDIIIVRCPGSYEIPLTVQKLLEKVDGVVALGAVIRGDTPHFEYVCDAVNRGISDLNLSAGKPVSFGVLTTDTVEQATKRADASSAQGNKGAEAALALLEMFSIVQQIERL